ATTAPLPTARQSLAVVALPNGKLYAVGGYNGSGYVSTVEEYDPATNVWTAGAAMPTPRAGMGVAAVGGRVYVLGGYNGGYLDTVEELDPATGAWATRTPMSTVRQGLAAALGGDGQPYPVGGEVGGRFATRAERARSLPA